MKMLGRKAFYIRGVAGQSCCRAGCCSETAYQSRLGYKRHVKRTEQHHAAQEIAAGIAEYFLPDDPDTPCRRRAPRPDRTQTFDVRAPGEGQR